METLVSYPFDRKGEVEFDFLEHPKHHLPESNLLDFPDDLTSLILGKLCFIKDKIYFGAVCHSFHSVFIEDTKQPCCPLPLLMVPSQDTSATHSFYSTFDDSTLFGEVSLDHSTFCRGTRHGWLVTVSEDLTVSLFNPFKSQGNNKIQLPPVTTFEAAPFDNDDVLSHHNTIHKATVSTDPLSFPEDFVVMAIYGFRRRLAFCKPGDKTWTTLTSQVRNFSDIIYFRDKFHVLRQNGEVFICDLNGDAAEPKLVKVAPSLNEVYLHDCRRYIVEAEATGDLLQITRDVEYETRPGVPGERCYTTYFKVFKMATDIGKWIEVHNLQGCLVFVGDNTSLSVCLPAHVYGSYKPNTIWLTDDNYEQQQVVREDGYGPIDVGVYDLEDGTVKTTYPMNHEFVAPPPIWIQPVLC